MEAHVARIPSFGHRVVFIHERGQSDDALPYGILYVRTERAYYINSFHGLKPISEQDIVKKYHKANNALLCGSGPPVRLTLAVYLADENVAETLVETLAESRHSDLPRLKASYERAADKIIEWFSNAPVAERLFLATHVHWEETQKGNWGADVHELLQTAIGQRLVASRTLPLHRGRVYLTPADVTINWTDWAKQSRTDLLDRLWKIVRMPDQCNHADIKLRATPAVKRIVVMYYTRYRRDQFKSLGVRTGGGNVELPPCMVDFSDQHLNDSLRMAVSGELDVISRAVNTPVLELVGPEWPEVALAHQPLHSIADFWKRVDARAKDTKTWSSTNCGTCVQGRSAIKCRGNPETCAKIAGKSNPTIFEVATRGTMNVPTQASVTLGPKRRRSEVRTHLN